MAVTLTNTTKRMKTFNLPHETYCSALGKCVCHTPSRKDKRRIPASLSLPVGQRIEGLPDVILQVPAIAQAVRRGEFRVDQVKAPQKKRKSDAPNKPPQTSNPKPSMQE